LLVRKIYYEGGGRGKGGEMTQTLYAHINKRKKIKKQKKKNILCSYYL
jgi:hypothetical protein